MDSTCCIPGAHGVKDNAYRLAKTEISRSPALQSGLVCGLAAGASLRGNQDAWAKET